MNTITKSFGITFAALHLLLLSCNGQNQQTIDPKAMDKILPEKYGKPQTITAWDTSPGWRLKGQKLLLTGTVYQPDGSTPAPNVVIYYYQTDTDGIYKFKPDERTNLPKNSLGQSHGYIRGWVKTDYRGKYAIYTIRPGTYPSRTEPAHVHVTITEPNSAKSYYIDDFVFDDDAMLTTTKRLKMENRGGSGVLRLVQKGNLQIGERNIILGLNVPGRLYNKTGWVKSGRNVGEDMVSFTPFHAWGPDKGTRTCPICKYGWFHGILYFVGNKPDWADIKKWLLFLEQESINREKYLKVYFIYGNTMSYNKAERDAELTRLGIELQLQKVALTFVPSFADRDSEIYLNRVNQNVGNTFILYKRSNVFAKFVDLGATSFNFKMLSNLLDKSKTEYFDLPQIKN